MTVVIEYPPGSPGASAHRHPGGPALGFMLEGEMLSEFDIKSRFLVTMLCVAGQPMLTLVDHDELAARAHLRVPAAPGSRFQ